MNSVASRVEAEVPLVSGTRVKVEEQNGVLGGSRRRVRFEVWDAIGRC